MEQALSYIQLILSILLIVSILLQSSGASVGGALGGAEGAGVFHTKRGFEKFLFYLSIVLAVLFAASALAAILLASN
jgi:protein translocase SecG subunit